MKTYQEFMLECSQLDEGGLSRIVSKAKKKGIAVLSGARGDKSPKENKARRRQLAKDIRGKGLPGPTKATGRWDEKDKKTGEKKKVTEPSLVVTSGKKSKRKFKKDIKSLGAKYKQDAVLIGTKPGKSATVSATRKGGLDKDKRIKAGKMRPGRSSPKGDTTVKKKPFTYG